jgi:hypothetical protein
MTRIVAGLLGIALTGCTTTDRVTVSNGATGTGVAGMLAGAGGTEGSPPLPQAGATAGSAGAGNAGSAGAAGAMIDAGSVDASMTPIDAGTLDTSVVEPVSCPASVLPAGDHEGSVSHDGRDRTYVMHVPSNYTGTAPVAVVLDFHGYGSSGTGQMGASGFRELSDQHGFIAVYPDGARCCCSDRRTPSHRRPDRSDSC